METNDSISKISITRNKNFKLENLFNKKLPKVDFLTKKITMMECFLLHSKQLKSVPTLIFPSYNNDEISNNSNYLSTKYSQKSHTPFLTSIPRATNIRFFNKSTNTLNTLLTKNNSVYRPTESSCPKNSARKILKSQQNKKVKKRVNLLDFGNKLKIYDSNEKVNKNLIKKRLKQLDEIYFDYDKKNDRDKMNSFSGNGAELLKKKIYFVKGVMDYLYPKYVLKRLHFLNEQKEKEFLTEMKELSHRKHDNYYLLSHQTAEEASRLSKFDHGGAFSNEAIKMKGDCIKRKKSLINNRTMFKYIKDYDFK